LKLPCLKQFFNRFNDHIFYTYQKGLSVFIYDKFCLYFFNNTFEIFLYEFYKLFRFFKEFFVEERVKKLIPLNIFSLSNWQLFRRWYRFKLIIVNLCWNLSYLKCIEGYFFLTLALKLMISPHVLNLIVLVNSGKTNSLSDYFPLIKKLMISKSIFRDIIHKFIQCHRENVIIICDYLYCLFIRLLKTVLFDNLCNFSFNVWYDLGLAYVETLF